jgi:hypothetical protein
MGETVGKFESDSPREYTGFRECGKCGNCHTLAPSGVSIFIMRQRVVFYCFLCTLTLLPVFASVTIASAQPPGRQREEEEQKKKQQEEEERKKKEEEQRKQDEERKKQEEEKRKKEDEERKKREEEAERQRVEARKREEEAQKATPSPVKRTNVVEPPARQREKEEQKEEKSKEAPPARQREEKIQQAPPPPQKETIVYYGSFYNDNDTGVYVYGGPYRGVVVETEAYSSGPHESSPAPFQVTLGSFYTTGYWLSTTVTMQTKPYFLDLAYYEDKWRIKSVGVGMRNRYPLQGRRLTLETGIGVYQTSGQSKANVTVTRQQVGLGGRIGLAIEERGGMRMEVGFRFIPGIASIKSQGVYLQAGKRF